MKVRSLKKVAVAITIDNNEPLRFHPRNKKMVGERLAGIALKRDYRLAAVPDSGPQFRSLQISPGFVRVFFKPGTTTGGLKTTDNLSPKHFCLAGADRVFYESEARIEENSIVLSSIQVKEPVAVRYAFTNDAVTNLVNAAGLPAEPFRTDNWKMPTIITIVHDKGGVGKSTLALNLAMHYNRDHDVVIVDTNANGCLGNLKLHHPGLNIVYKKESALIKKLPNDLVIVDLSSGSADEIMSFLSVSDFALIPVKPNFFDIAATYHTLNTVARVASRHTLQSAIVFNMVKPGCRDLEAYVAHFKNYRVNLMNTIIHDRPQFSNTPLQGGVLNRNSHAYKEISALAGEIDEMI